MPVKGGYLLATGAGALLLWSGLKGKSWSASLRDILSGSTPATTLTAYPITPGIPGSPLPGGPSDTGSGESGGTPAKNKAIGRVLAAAYGWGAGPQWNALVRLWDQESGWNNRARNPESGAYGIPQALPASKLPQLGLPPISSASAQIGWGLTYIRQRYGNPVNAWAQEQTAGWY